MAFHAEKDLKSKNTGGKKVYILAKDVNTERKLEIKGSKSNCLNVFCKIFSP